MPGLVCSVIIPCRNEEPFIARCLRSLFENDCPLSCYEVIVADGQSTDGTLAILMDFAREHPNLRVVPNPERSTSSGLNHAIRAATGRFIIRVDAHARVERQYLASCLKASEESGADNVGGIMYTHAAQDGPFADSIIFALSHKFGVGNSVFRVHSKEPRWVDTVFGGCYRREVFDKIGLFNERLVRGQDMEFNRRLVKAGGRILFVPQIVSHYYARSTLPAFCRHNWSNGQWAIFPFLYTDVMPVSWRHLVPLAFVVSVLALLILSQAYPLLYPALAAVLLSYGLAALVASIDVVIRERQARLLFTMPLAFALLHIGYGLGSLWAVVQLPFIVHRRNRFPVVGERLS